jgi:hypothetical protein
MDLQPYADRISAQVPALAQVLIADTLDSIAPLDTAPLLVTDLSSAVGGRLYPLHQGERPSYPNAVYELVASQRLEQIGYGIVHIETYLLHVRTDSYATLISTVEALSTAIAGSSYAIEISDMAAYYDAEQQHYRATLELTFALVNAATQSLPVAVLYPVDSEAGESLYDNCVRQRERRSFGVVLLTLGADLPTLRDAVQAALLGYQIGVDYDAVELVAGAPLPGAGRFGAWRDIYRDARIISA